MAGVSWDHKFVLRIIWTAPKVTVVWPQVDVQVNLCFLYFNPRDCVSQLGKVLAEKPEEGATNGQVFDREAYLR